MEDPIVTEKPETKSEAKTETPTPSGVSRDEVSAMLKDALGPVTETLRSLNQNFARAAEPPPPGDDLPDEEEYAGQFYKQPRATILRTFQEAARPLVAQQADLTSTLYLESAKAQISAEFGPEAWDKVFAPRLNPVFEELRRTDPVQLTNRIAIENAIDTVKGKNFKTLAEMQKSFADNSEKSELQRLADLKAALAAESGNLTGGVRQTDGKPRLDEEQRAILSAMRQHDGIVRDENLLAHAMNVSNVDEWRAMKKSLNGKAN